MLVVAAFADPAAAAEAVGAAAARAGDVGAGRVGTGRLDAVPAVAAAVRELRHVEVHPEDQLAPFFRRKANLAVAGFEALRERACRRKVVVGLRVVRLVVRASERDVLLLHEEALPLQPGERRRLALAASVASSALPLEDRRHAPQVAERARIAQLDALDRI